jgi:molybdate transport system substrate-binding protein
MAKSDIELTVFCTLGLAGVMEVLGPAFEREAGVRLALRTGPTNAFKPDIAADAPFDLAILTAAAIDEFRASGRIAGGSRTDIARSCIGVTVPPGAQKPDIATVAAFKAALLAAPSIVFTGQGASGQHFARLLPQLGIEAEVRANAVVTEGLVATRVVTGEIALGIQQLSEILAVPGAVLVGPIPQELQAYTMFSAGLGAAAHQPDLARALVARLRARETRELLTAKGLEPA